MLLCQLRQFIRFTYGQIIIKGLHHDVINSNHVILSTSLVEVHLVKASTHEVSLETIILFISVYVFTFRVDIWGSHTKINERDIAIFSIYHNILRLKIIEHYFWAMYYFENVNEPLEYF